MGFHRLVIPSYPGGLPAGYDLVNDPHANGDPGAPAFADGKKGSGPNHGTYFVAFGEDATNNNVNRGFRALSENTDFLDDVLHRDLAITKRTADVLAASAVSSLVIAGEVFVGTFGAPNDADQRRRSISVLDENDQEILTASGVAVEAAVIHDGSGNNVVGQIPRGFFNTPTVVLSSPIPPGIRYRIYYGERSSLAELPRDALTSITIRGAEEVSSKVELLFRMLHAPGALQSWDGPFDSTIRDLARSGLDERYRRATTGSGALNRAGDGATITRDGKALTVAAPDINVFESGDAPDPFMAQFAATLAGPSGIETDPSFGGHVGLAVETARRNSSDPNERTKRGEHMAAFLSYIPRDIRADELFNPPLGNQKVHTRITPSAEAELNPDSGSSVEARRTIRLGSPNYFSDPDRATAVRLGIDLLVVTFPSGKERAYVIDEFDSSSRSRARLKTQAGLEPDFGDFAQTVSVRWVQVSAAIGGTTRELRFYDGFFFAPPGKLTEGGESERDQCSRIFVAPSDSPHKDSDTTALEWGGVRRRENPGIGPAMGHIGVNGVLAGDGGVLSRGGRVTGFFQHRSTPVVLDAAFMSLHWAPTRPSGSSESGHILSPLVHFQVNNGGADLILTLVLEQTDMTPTEGDELIAVFTNTSGSKAQVLWAPINRFAFGEGDNLVASQLGSVTIFRFLYLGHPVNRYVAKRDVYLSLS